MPSGSRKVVYAALAGNARAKMADLSDGFVKLFCRPASGQIVGGVVVAPKASELVLPISLAVENNLTVDHLAAIDAPPRECLTWELDPVPAPPGRARPISRPR